MGIRWSTAKWRAVVLRALLSLMLALAPLLAQTAMTGHASAAPQTAAAANHDTAGHAHHDQSGRDHSHHNHSDDDLVTAGHSHDVAMPDVKRCPGGHGDHDNAGDVGCCGTFCHSTMALLVMQLVNQQYCRSAFSSFAEMPTDSVAPEQPHRPPSVLLSL
jgi:hypothetical protein